MSNPEAANLPPVSSPKNIVVRNTLPADFDAVQDICRRVYPDVGPWEKAQLQRHIDLFPEGQLVAEDTATGRLVGMAASLIILWEDYELDGSWRDFTDNGWFSNHDPENGRTLYGAEVMVDPLCQRCGVGGKIYAARRDLTIRLGLRRIRAGSRLRGYGAVADKYSIREYVDAIQRGEEHDPTLTFQLRHGFRVIGVVEDYLRRDPESLGAAAVIEWKKPE